MYTCDFQRSVVKHSVSFLTCCGLMAVLPHTTSMPVAPDVSYPRVGWQPNWSRLFNKTGPLMTGLGVMAVSHCCTSF